MKKQTHCKRGHTYIEGSFYLSVHKDGHEFRQCKQCLREYQRARYAALSPEERAARRKSFPSAAKGKHYQRKYKYGITEAAYRELLIAQDGLCIVCLKEGATHLDHDHETGTVRGILCGSCNRAIGLFREDPDALEFAAEYVKGVA